MTGEVLAATQVLRAPALELRGVRRVFRLAGTELKVLNGVDLVLRPGEIVALVGPSGAGKSTVLHVAGLLERPDGGAVLIAAGPDYASPTSIWRTPLDGILPAEPTGEITERSFQPQLTDAGHRHPVTRNLEGSETDPPHWSRWFRLVDIKRSSGTNVMQGPDGKPLLVLAREGEGRVALLLSDHIWLWARGRRLESNFPGYSSRARISDIDCWLTQYRSTSTQQIAILVRTAGLEPARGCPQGILSLLQTPHINPDS